MACIAQDSGSECAASSHSPLRAFSSDWDELECLDGPIPLSTMSGPPRVNTPDPDMTPPHSPVLRMRKGEEGVEVHALEGQSGGKGLASPQVVTAESVASDDGVE